MNYMPHGHCIWWEPWPLWLNASGDIVIALSYFMIPTLMMWIAWKRGGAIPPLVIAFSLFIILCGMGHVMDVWNYWHGDYILQGWIRQLTAWISVITVWLLAKESTFLMVGYEMPQMSRKDQKNLLKTLKEAS